MVPLLVFWLLRFIRRRNKAVCLGISLFSVTGLFAQPSSRMMQYEVRRHGDSIGYVQIRKWEDGTLTRIDAVSGIRFRFITRFQIRVKEEVIFRKQCMELSQLNRWWNGSEKVNHQTILSGGVYRQVSQPGHTLEVPYYPVGWHVLQLYFNEPPEDCEWVYSENLQGLLRLYKTGSHRYRLQLSGDDYNEYEYENGICRRVRLANSWYTAEMILIKP